MSTTYNELTQDEIDCMANSGITPEEFTTIGAVSDRYIMDCREGGLQPIEGYLVGDSLTGVSPEALAELKMCLEEQHAVAKGLSLAGPSELSEEGFNRVFRTFRSRLEMAARIENKSGFRKTLDKLGFGKVSRYPQY